MMTCSVNRTEGGPGRGDQLISNTNGCSFIPDILLNHEACVIHDLCYVTPGASKTQCDDSMQKNINRVYCDNVNQ